MTPSELQRLRDVDLSLASREGLHVSTMANRHGCSDKTIRRDIALLGSVVCPTKVTQIVADNGLGRSWIHRYTDRRKRMFR